MAKNLDAEIAALRERLKKKTAEKQQIQARKRALEAKKKRENDTRRKILIGAMFLEDAKTREDIAGYIKTRLPRFLTRADDQALFPEVFLPQDSQKQREDTTSD